MSIIFVYNQCILLNSKKICNVKHEREQYIDSYIEIMKLALVKNYIFIKRSRLS